MRRLTDEQILKKYPGGIAEIVPVVDEVANRVVGGQPTRMKSRIQSISLRISTEMGVSPLTGQLQFRHDTYDIGPFTEDNQDVGIRTDNCGRATSDHSALKVLRALLEHDGHKNADGQLMNFDLRPVEAEVLALEQEAKKNPEVKKEIDSLKRAKGYKVAKAVTRGKAPAVPGLSEEDENDLEEAELAELEA